MLLASLQRVDPAENIQRFYRIALLPTLFGDWTLVREWGRLGSPGQVRVSWHANADEAGRAGERLRQQKERRGYELVQSGPAQH